jgi:hypothetical protein
MVFDVEQHEKNKALFLKAMYEMRNECIAVNPNMPDPSRWFAGINRIVERAGLGREELIRIPNELQDDAMIEAIPFPPNGDQGQEYQFTPRGLQAANQLLYDESALGKRRKIVGAIRETSAAGAMSLLKEAGKWLGGIVIGAAGASYGPALT